MSWKKVAASLFLSSLIMSGATAQNRNIPPLPGQLDELIASHYPQASVLSYTEPCNATSSSFGIQQLGIILASNTHESAPLKAIIAVYSAHEWSISEIAPRVQYALGKVENFLEDFNTKTLPEIRCATPDSDKDIGTKANGAFILKNKQALAKQAKHICFQASTTYNDWVCYWTPANSAGPKLSFVQFNAD